MGACLSAPPPQQQGAQYRPPAVSAAAARQEALFFPDAAMPCHRWMRGQRCTRKHCDYSHQHTSLSKLVWRLGEARSTLDVCVFTISCKEIFDAIVAAAARGVRVRVVTDDEKMQDQGSKAFNLKAQRGVEVRNDRNERSHMHHKFAVVDGRMLLNGSFNWTRSAVLNNRENVVISHDPYLVADFANEFNRLWEEFKYNR